jgi:hypothetical protein
MARKERSAQELHERAYDGFDFGSDDDFEDDPSDPFLAEMEQYGKSVLDGSYKAPPKPAEPKKP